MVSVFEPAVENWTASMESWIRVQQNAVPFAPTLLEVHNMLFGVFKAPNNQPILCWFGLFSGDFWRAYCVVVEISSISVQRNLTPTRGSLLIYACILIQQADPYRRYAYFIIYVVQRFVALCIREHQSITKRACRGCLPCSSSSGGSSSNQGCSPTRMIRPNSMHTRSFQEKDLTYASYSGARGAPTLLRNHR